VSGSCLDLATRTVFVTSGVYDGVTIASVANANVLCQGLATAAGLLGTYNAFLSDESNDAADNLTHAPVPYTLVDGTIVANNWAGLISGNLLAAINMTESRGAAPAGTIVCGTSNVYTGSDAQGLRIAGDTCLNWTSNADFGAVGSSSRTDSLWAAWCGVPCNRLGALYCFEQ
jgi:hypothetical protein